MRQAIVRPIKFAFQIGHSAEKAILNEVVKLPLLRRLSHRKTKRHIFAVSLGGGICLVGSVCAHNAEHLPLLPSLCWDAIGYGIHGVGLSPIIVHFDPLWRIIMGYAHEGEGTVTILETGGSGE